jgi:hypothetical protein
MCEMCGVCDVHPPQCGELRAPDLTWLHQSAMQSSAHLLLDRWSDSAHLHNPAPTVCPSTPSPPRWLPHLHAWVNHVRVSTAFCLQYASLLLIILAYHPGVSGSDDEGLSQFRCDFLGCV